MKKKSSGSPTKSSENGITRDEADDCFLEVDTKSASKWVLRKLLAASPCGFCGERPRLFLCTDNGESEYSFGCSNFQIGTLNISDAFAQWEKESPREAASSIAWVTKRREKLNARMTINAKFTADDWAIWGRTARPAEVMADELNRALNDAVQMQQSRKETYKYMVTAMRRHKCGLAGLGLLEEMLDYIFAITPGQADSGGKIK
jgi:hypothetical protein